MPSWVTELINGVGIVHSQSEDVAMARAWIHITRNKGAHKECSSAGIEGWSVFSGWRPSKAKCYVSEVQTVIGGSRRVLNVLPAADLCVLCVLG